MAEVVRSVHEDDRTDAEVSRGFSDERRESLEARNAEFDRSEAELTRGIAEQVREAAETARRLADELRANVVELGNSHAHQLTIMESMRLCLGELVTRLDAYDAHPKS